MSKTQKNCNFLRRRKRWLVAFIVTFIILLALSLIFSLTDKTSRLTRVSWRCTISFGLALIVFIVATQKKCNEIIANQKTSQIKQSQLDKIDNATPIEQPITNQTDTSQEPYLPSPEKIETYDSEAQEQYEDFDEQSSDYLREEFQSKFNYSFIAKLTLSNYETKEYYKQITQFVSGYEVKRVRGWKRERIYLGRQIFAIMIFKGKTLAVALALNPQDYKNSKYKFTDLSVTKRYEKTPMLIKITSDKKLSQILELLEIEFLNADIKKSANPDFKPEKIKTKTRKQLVKEGLIKTNVPIEEIED